MSNIKDSQTSKHPIVTNDPYNHTCVALYICFEVKFELSKMSQLLKGVNSTVSIEKDDYFR